MPFSLVTLIQGGSLDEYLDRSARLSPGGSHNFGSIGLPIFDLSGITTGIDAETGLTLGTGRPLQTGGPLFETSNATVNAHQGVRVDTALLEATAPLLVLTNGSKLTTAADTVQLSYQAKVTSLGSIVKLDRSALTVANGRRAQPGGWQRPPRHRRSLQPDKRQQPQPAQRPARQPDRRVDPERQRRR